jgi:diguanylate cyclase (GGDEF)-like protein
MITKKVFNDLAIYMIGFGVSVGILFPFFVVITGVPANLVLTPLFFFLCIAAGFIVGLINIFLARKIVGKKLKQLSYHMSYIENHLINRTVYQNTDDCTGENCFIKIDSEDEIGESAHAFNALVKSLMNAFKSEIAIRTFTEMLSSRLELDELAEEALNRLMTNLNAEGAAIIIEKEGELSILSSFGIKTPESILESNMIWKVIKNQKRLIIELPEDILLNGLLVDFRPKSIMIEPITYKDIILGVVILAGANTFTDEMQNSMELFGHGLALAFRNAIMHDQLQKLAANDPLTGIFNRRFGLTRLKEEFSRAVRNNLPIGVLIFDIDHFKKINDTYGHIVGDKVLIRLTQAAKLALREGDIFLRYGGEEFLVILPGASITDAYQISERLRHIIEDTEVPHNSQVIKITISIGGTSYPEREAIDMNTLINTADKNLYQAKETGRNKSIID